MRGLTVALNLVCRLAVVANLASMPTNTLRFFPSQVNSKERLSLPVTFLTGLHRHMFYSFDAARRSPFRTCFLVSPSGDAISTWKGR